MDSLGRTTGRRTVLDPAATSPELVTEYQSGFDRIGQLMYEQRRHEQIGASGTTWRTRAYTHDLMGRVKERKDGETSGDNPLVPTNSTPTGSILNSFEGESWVMDLLGNLEFYIQHFVIH